MNKPANHGMSSKADLPVVLGLLAAAILVFIPFLGATGMFDPTDSFFIESAREMLRTHEFCVPMMNYEQWLDKPALVLWLIISSYKAFGVNEFAGRLPSALSGIAIVLTTYLLSARILTKRQALLSSLVLLSSPLFVVVGHVSLTDEPLCLFLTATLLSFANRIIKGSFSLLCLGFFTLSLGILCKGPLALALVGLITLGYLIARGHKQLVPSILKLHPLLAVLIVAALVLPYYVWAHVHTHGQFTRTFFLSQNLGRIAGNLNHVRPFWFYLPVVALGTFPWSLVLALAGKSIQRLWKRRASDLTRREQLLLFSLCWALLGFILFSSVPTKLETYIVPILPAISIIAGCYLDVVIRAKSSRSQTVIATICGVAVCACAVLVPLFFHLYHGHEQQSIDRLALYARQRGANLAIVRYELPSLIFRFEHKIPEIQDEKDMHQFADATDGPQWIFVHHDVLSLLSWTERSPRVVAYEGKWWLFAVGRNSTREGTVEWLGLDHGPYPTLNEILHK